MHQDDCWYLSDGGTNDTYHQGHVYLSPNDIVIPYSLIPQDTINVVKTLIDNQVAIPSLLALVKRSLGIELSKDTVRYIKDQAMELRMEDALQVQNPSSADRLLATLKSMDDCNFIYTTHHIGSGFVTCKKQRKRISTSSVTEDSVGISAADIESWRRDFVRKKVTYSAHFSGRS